MKDGKSWYSYHGNLHDLTFYNIYPIQTIIKYGVRTKHKATSHQMTLYLTLSLSLSLSETLTLERCFLPPQGALRGCPWLFCPGG